MTPESRTAILAQYRALCHRQGREPADTSALVPRPLPTWHRDGWFRGFDAPAVETVVVRWPDRGKGGESDDY